MKITNTSEACARVRDRLERLLDGGLEPVETARDQGHLEACAECAREEARLEGFLGAIRKVSVTEAGELSFAREGLEDRLRAAAFVRPRFRLLHGRVVRAAATAAAALVALFALELVGSGLGDFGSLPGWTGNLLDRTSIELPGWADVFRNLWNGGGF